MTFDVPKNLDAVPREDLVAFLLQEIVNVRSYAGVVLEIAQKTADHVGFEIDAEHLQETAERHARQHVQWLQRQLKERVDESSDESVH